MATGTAGGVGRQFHTQQIHYLRATVSYTQAGTAVTVGVLPAGAVIIPAISGALVTTAFTGSGTDLIDIGTTANDDLYATDLDVSSLGLKVLDEAVTMAVSSDTTITATYADQNSNAGAGVAEIIIAYIPDNDA